jgi:hypothetical protein
MRRVTRGRYEFEALPLGVQRKVLEYNDNGQGAGVIITKSDIRVVPHRGSRSDCGFYDSLPGQLGMTPVSVEKCLSNDGLVIETSEKYDTRNILDDPCKSVGSAGINSRDHYVKNTP